MVKKAFWFRIRLLLAVLLTGALLAGAGSAAAQQALQDNTLPQASINNSRFHQPDATPQVLHKYGSARRITDEHYRLGISDKLKVTVYGEEDLSGEFMVDSSGQVQLPLVGQVRAATLTLHEFRDEVTQALKAGYLKDPRVSIEVMNYRPFYIMGEVNKPGEYPYENGMTVLSAIALAGGFTYRADDDEVFIRHNGEAEGHTVPADSKTRVVPGDIIRIPERIF